MKLVKLLDGVFLRFAGFAFIRVGADEYTWRPRYDNDGNIYAWIRDELPNVNGE